MTPGVAASFNEVRAAASSLVTRSAGSAFVVEAGVAGVATTLSTSLTHVEAASAAVFTGAAVLAGVAVLEGDDDELQAARPTSSPAITATGTEAANCRAGR
jgi:hypothetical protein